MTALREPIDADTPERDAPSGVWRRLVGAGAALAYIAGLAFLWWAFVRVFSVDPLLLPSPEDVWTRATEHTALLFESLFVTLQEGLLGFALALVVGVALAIAIVSSRIASKVLLPTLVAVNATPKVVVAPILVIWLGLGIESKVGMAFLLAFFPIVISMVQGLGDVEPDLVNLYRLMRARRSTILRRVRMPNAVPHLMSGCKIALPLALIGAVIGEFVAAQEGIGFQIVLAYSNFDTEMVFAAVILITLASVVLFQLLVWLEAKLLVWRPRSFEAR